jgi:hypothetical protein
VLWVLFSFLNGHSVSSTITLVVGNFAAMFVLRTLDPAAYCLKYIYFQVDSVSVENHLFMTLMKLRRYTTT